MKALFLIVCVVLGLWAIIALAVALAPYMFGIIAFVAALWLIFWVGNLLIGVIGVWLDASRNGRQ